MGSPKQVPITASDSAKTFSNVAIFLSVILNRKTLITIFKYGISIAILSWLCYNNKGEFDEFLQSEKNYGWLALSAVTITLAFFVSYVRWHHLAGAIRLQLSFLDAIKLGFIGSFFNVVAFGVVGGDSLRAYYAARNSPDRIPEAILSVFLDRFIGLCVMFGFAATSWMLFGPEVSVTSSATQKGVQYTCQFAGICAFVGFAGLFSFVLMPNVKNLGLIRWFYGLPKIGGLIEQGINAATLYSNNKLVLIKAIIFSLVTNSLFAVTIYLVAIAITDSPPSLADHFVMAPIAMVANAVPLPGGVGGMEAALPALYQGFEAEGGFVVALGFRMCILLVSLIGLFVWLAYRSKMPVPEEASD